MNASHQKAFDAIFGRSVSALKDARIENMAAAVTLALRFAQSNNAEFERLIAALTEQVEISAKKLGAV